jgi:hypothetical protein
MYAITMADVLNTCRIIVTYIVIYTVIYIVIFTLIFTVIVIGNVGTYIEGGSRILQSRTPPVA